MKLERCASIKFTVKSSAGGRKNWIWNLRPLSQKTSLYELNKLHSCETRTRVREINQRWRATEILEICQCGLKTQGWAFRRHKHQSSIRRYFGVMGTLSSWMCRAINLRDSNASQAILAITSPKNLPNVRVANRSQIIHSNSTIQYDQNANDLGPPPPLEASAFSEMSDSGMVFVSRAKKLGVCIILPCFQIITSTISQIFLGKISTALWHVHVYYLHSVQL